MRQKPPYFREGISGWPPTWRAPSKERMLVVNLEGLQKNGAIHIGLKSSQMVLYAYRMESRPDLVALGWTREKVVAAKTGPQLASVADRVGADLRLMMVCHHSSARELVSKIRDKLTLEGQATVAPDGVSECDQEWWFKATLDDLVFAYPPFAKIFLSEVPTFVDKRERGAKKEAEEAIREASRTAGSFDTARRRGAEDEEADAKPTWKEILTFRTDGSRTLLSLAMIFGIIGGAAFMTLEQMKKSPGGRAMLLSAEHAIGFSLGTQEGRGFGFLTPAEREARAPTVVVEGPFRTWYDPVRGNDAGSTFGMPKEIHGFQIRTWVDGPITDRNLYAAYRFNPEITWRPETESQRLVSRRLLADLLRADDMAQDLHEEACELLNGDASSYTSDVFAHVDMVLVHDTNVLLAIQADASTCERGVPRHVERRPTP